MEERTQERQSTTIDGLTFTVQQLGGRAGVKMLHRLGRTLGPAMASLIAGVLDAAGELDNMKDWRDLDHTKITPVLEATVIKLFANLTEAEIDPIINGLLQSATVSYEGKEVPLLPVFDRVLQGKTLTVIRLVAFSVGVNYGNFFDAARALALPYMEKTRRPSSAASPSTSKTAGLAGAS